MKPVHVFATLCATVLLVSHANAQGTLAWAGGYPTASGTNITLKGTVTADAGWSIKAMSATFWVNGKSSKDYIVNANAQGQWPLVGGKWKEASYAVDLANTDYNVLVVAIMDDGKQTRKLLLHSVKKTGQ